MEHLSNIRSSSVDKATVPGWAPPGSAATALDAAIIGAGRVGMAGATPGDRPDPGPLPIGTPKVDEALAQPMRYAFPYAVNQTLTPRAGSTTPFATLRQFADVCDVLRICIESRKDQLTSLSWDVALKDSKGKPDAKLKTKMDDARRALFGKPDGRRRFHTWLRMAIEEVLVVDALAIFRRRTYGGKLFALELKDGATFKPLLDASGETPMPPYVAYRQIINGRPIAGGDCTITDLLYRPRTVRTHTPYGLSPTEAVLLTINALINREVFSLQYYSEGNVPEGLISAPENWSPQQIREFQEYFDALLAGNLSMRRRLKIVGKGMTEHVHQFKEPSFDTKFDEWLLKIICGALAVPPQEIGFTGDVNKATAGMQENVVYRRGVKPLASFFKDIFDEILEDDLDCAEMEAVFNGGEPEDLLVKAQSDQLYVAMGKTSVDELRVRDGEEPIGLGPYVLLPSGPVFVDELINGVDDDPLTTDVDPNSPIGAAAAGTGSTGTQTTDDDPDADDPAPTSDEGGDELRKWRRVALQCVKRGQPIRKFRADHLSPALVETIDTALASVSTLDGVVGVFNQVEKARTVAQKLRKAERSLHRKSAAILKDQGTALAAHLLTNIRALPVA